jgi:hypothetical protein
LAASLARQPMTPATDVLAIRAMKDPRAKAERMPLPGDRERLKRSFISIFVEHPIITLLIVVLAGALVFGNLLN